MKRAVLLMLLLGACVSAPKRPVVQPPAPRPAPAPLPPPPPVAWEDRARSPGQWRYANEGNFSEAAYAFTVGDVGRNLLRVECRRSTDRRIALSAHALSGTMLIRTTTMARTLPLADGAALLVATDPLLDAMIFSRGKILVGVNGREEIVPPFAELARVVEDCRS